jgi:terminase small subunit-like protein
MSVPSTFSDEIFDEICRRLADGKTLLQICRDPEMPSRETVRRWIGNDDVRRRQYDQARRDGTDSLADELVELGWDTSNDTLINEKGTPVANHDWLGRVRIKSETIRFLLAKLNPRRYGDRMPDVIAAKEMDAEQAQIPAQPIHRLERIILTSADPTYDEHGNPYPNSARALQARIAELEAQLAGRSPERETPPALLEYDPGLPRRMDQDIARRMVTLIRDHVPIDGSRDPAAVLDEVHTIIRDALRAHFGPTGELVESLAAV